MFQHRPILLPVSELTDGGIAKLCECLCIMKVPIIILDALYRRQHLPCVHAMRSTLAHTQFFFGSVQFAIS